MTYNKRMSKHRRRNANVASLDLHPHAAVNPERIAHIKRWHIDQATRDDAQSVATLNISITSTGEIRTSTVAIEPAHAQVILGELGHISTLLREFIGANQPPSKNVIRLKRTA
jgi:hypothetical protein